MKKSKWIKCKKHGRPYHVLVIVIKPKKLKLKA